MTITLTIRNLAVIRKATLPLEGSFLALLGETGAGKSLVVDALLLLKGARFDRTLLRDGEEECEVQALFSSDGSEGSLPPLFDEEGEATLRRVIRKDGTSRQWINGDPVSLRELRERTEKALSVHRQGQNEELFDPRSALRYVDCFGVRELAEARRSYSEAYQDYVEKSERLAELLSSEKEMDRDYLDFQIQEIEKHRLVPGEIEELTEELSKLRDVDKIQTVLERFHLSSQLEEGDLFDLLSTALDSLRPLSETSLAQQAKEVSDKARSLLFSLEDLRDGFRQIQEKAEAVDEMNQRLFELKPLQRKFGATTQEILSRLEEFKARREQIDQFDATKRHMEEEKEEARRAATEKGRELSRKRQEVSQVLQEKIGGQMKDLGLPEDGIALAWKNTDLKEDGMDECEFLVQLNQGLSSHELSKVASGGEGARLMLAIKAVLNRLDPALLLVFDEIDAGVSGRMARLMGEKMREISKDSMVLVISHLPQVVALAKAHVGVRKEVVEGVTASQFRLLDGDEVVQELAKMISGRKKTESALLQARELYDEGRR